MYFKTRRFRCGVCVLVVFCMIFAAIPALAAGEVATVTADAPASEFPFDETMAKCRRS